MEGENIEELTNEEIILSGLSGGLEGRRKRRTAAEIGASRFRRQMLERLHMLPKHVQRALKSQKAQISDAPFYSTGEIQGTRAELIKISKSEELGFTNIDNGKLSKDRFLVLSAIQLLYDKDGKDGAFKSDYPAELLNGEWELELNGRKVYEKMPIRKFDTGIKGYDTNKPFGMYVLNNPKMVTPQTPIEFNVSLPKSAEGFLKVFFIGTTVYGY